MYRFTKSPMINTIEFDEKINKFRFISKDLHTRHEFVADIEDLLNFCQEITNLVDLLKNLSLDYKNLLTKSVGNCVENTKD